MNHRKQKILDDISKKEVFLEKFFMYWYDGEYDGKRESDYIEDEFGGRTLRDCVMKK